MVYRNAIKGMDALNKQRLKKKKKGAEGMEKWDGARAKVLFISSISKAASW